MYGLRLWKMAWKCPIGEFSGRFVQVGAGCAVLPGVGPWNGDVLVVRLGRVPGAAGLKLPPPAVANRVLAKGAGMLEVRAARTGDAGEMSAILAPILAGWNSDRPSAPAHVLAHYIEHSDRIACSVAVDAAGEILGFQSLKAARPGNPYGLPEGWGIIGTYVRATAGRQGVGKALFAASLRAAKAAGVSEIDATIGADNALGLGYYEALGFRTYREKPGAVCKKLIVS